MTQPIVPGIRVDPQAVERDNRRRPRPFGEAEHEVEARDIEVTGSDAQDMTAPPLNAPPPGNLRPDTDRAPNCRLSSYMDPSQFARQF
jgi:hypothetical protein